MTREIKFRAWDLDSNDRMYSWEEIKNTLNEHLKHERIIVMQFTGLKDKNGVEIYEGDILKWKCSKSGTKKECNYIVTINWDRHNYSLTIHDKGEKWATGKSYWNELDRELIGNIYENPELQA